MLLSLWIVAKAKKTFQRDTRGIERRWNLEGAHHTRITRVLLIDENDPSPDAVCTGWWMMDAWRDYGDIGCNGQEDYAPTHWMPLPFGPGATISNGETAAQKQEG